MLPNRSNLTLFFLLFLNNEVLRARLVIEFKNCCLKRCENYSLKSVVKIRFFSVYKTKKCVWYVCLI